MLEVKSISPKEQLSFAIGAIGKDMAFAFTLLGLFSYLEQSVIIGSTLLSLVPVIAKLLDAISDPIIGLIIDKTKSKYGKFKPYILIGSILFAISTLIYILQPKVTSNLSFICSCFIYFIVCACYSLLDVAFWSLIPTFGSKSTTRDQMALMGRLGALIGYQLVVLPTFFIEETPNNQYLFEYRPYFILLIFVLSQFILLINVQDRSIKYTTSYNFKIGSLIHFMLKNNQLMVISLIVFLLQFISYLAISTATILFHPDQQSTKYFYITFLTSTIGQLLAYLAYLKLRSFVQRRSIFIFSILTIILAIPLLALALSHENPLLMYISYFLIYSSLALCVVCTTVMQANVVDYGEFKNDCRTEGLSFSMQTMSTKIAIALSTMLIYFTPKIDLFFKNKELTICLIILAIAFIATLIMLFIYLRFYKLSGSFYLHMLNTLDKLRGINNKEDLNYTSVRYAIDEDCILMNQSSTNLFEIIDNLSERLINNNLIDNPMLFKQQLFARLRANSCGIAEGIAIAHLKSNAVRRSSIALATLQQGIDCHAIDDKKCNLIFLIASPNDPNEHLNVLGKLSLLLNEHQFCNSIRTACSQAEILEQIIKFEKSLV